MMRRPPLHWIAFIALLLLAAPLVMLWRMTAGGGALLPIERFLPRRVSAVICLRHAQAAWQRHWTRRPGPAPEDALKALYIACDQWDREVGKHGELQARVRLGLYQQAFFQAVGDEAWAAFGEWGGDTPGTGQVGLMIFMRGDTPLRSRVAPLLDLLLGDYKIKRTRCAGETLLEYEGKTERRSVTFCQFGGWICVSLRQGGPGPLPEIIRQVRADAAPTSASAQSAVALLGAPAGEAAILAGMRPRLFLDQMRAFNNQTGQKLSKKSRKQFDEWEKRVEGIERVTLRQAGEAIFDFELAAEGPRLAAINHEALITTSPLAAVGAFTLQTPRNTPEIQIASPDLAQIDFYTPLAGQTAALAGYSWNELLDEPGAMDLVLPGLRPRFQAALATKKHPGPGRIGLAAYPSPAVIVPNLLFWRDRWVLSTERTELAAGRLAGLLKADRVTTRTECSWIGMPPASPHKPGPAAVEYGRLADEVWMLADPPPLAFLGINFRDLAAELEKLPNLFMKKDQRKQMERWKATANTLALSAGAGAARIDASGPRWVMTVRMP